MSNTNPETGIRYGTVYCNSLNQDLVQELWFGSQAKDLSYEAAYEEAKAEAEAKYLDLVDQAGIAAAETGADREIGFDSEKWVNDWLADNGGHPYDMQEFVGFEMQCFFDNCHMDEPTIEGTYEGVEYHISWLGGAPLLWVFKSDVIVKANLCSPCVPNAGNLDSLDPEGGEVCYGIPSDWYYKETA